MDYIKNSLFSAQHVYDLRLVYFIDLCILATVQEGMP
jgi:hypothetical protein